mmetsp:Transcript_10332/g.29509  ORF Transcript_10332/g.29509 Transcript_10332/m.29509 type:complete len:275 (+) Transcript_10332:381-1205(+)
MLRRICGGGAIVLHVEETVLHRGSGQVSNSRGLPGRLGDGVHLSEHELEVEGLLVSTRVHAGFPDFHDAALRADQVVPGAAFEVKGRGEARYVTAQLTLHLFHFGLQRGAHRSKWFCGGLRRGFDGSTAFPIGGAVLLRRPPFCRGVFLLLFLLLLHLRLPSLLPGLLSVRSSRGGFWWRGYGQQILEGWDTRHVGIRRHQVDACISQGEKQLPRPHFAELQPWDRGCNELAARFSDLDFDLHTLRHHSIVDAPSLVLLVFILRADTKRRLQFP